MTKKGFTLIELMVIVTIMLIMTAIVLFNYTQFNESTLLNTFAYDLSLTIRQAQTYGVATKEGTSNISDPIDVNTHSNLLSDFQNAYGVHFDISPNATVPLELFIDAPTVCQSNSTICTGNGIYDTVNDHDISLQSYIFQRGIKIREICINDSDTTGKCLASTQIVSGSLDITFRRPDPEAIIIADKTGNPASMAEIILANSDNTITKTVTVYETGQISVLVQ